MKTANTATATKAIPVEAATGWKFTATTAALSGHTFDATYSVARSGDVYVFAQVSGTPIRIHVAQGAPMYHACLEAAMAAKAASKQPAKQAEQPAEKPAEQPAKQAAPKGTKPAKAAKQPKAAAEPAKPVEQPAEQPAKQAAPKATKPAKAAKQPKAAAEPAKPAEQPASQAEPADAKAWIGTAITGKGWRIAFDEATQRTRVCFDAAPSAKQKEAIEAAGFYWSAQLQSWNKKLTCKAYRAAQALAASLNALA